MIQTTQLQPLPRSIRRRNLRDAVKRGKPTYDQGLHDGKLAGFREGYAAGQQAMLDQISADVQRQVEAAQAADPQTALLPEVPK